MENGQDRTPVVSDYASRLQARIENTPYNGDLVRIPHFGIWNPNIKEAAELVVVVDTWFSGEIEGVNEPEDFDGSACAPWLKAALADAITAFQARLASAIDSGRLKASAIRRDLDDRLIPEKTHVSYDHLVEWMDERGLAPGDHMVDWEETEATISMLICDEVAFLRNACMSGNAELRCKSWDLRFRALSREIVTCHSSLGGEFGERIDLSRMQHRLRRRERSSRP
jgi:hypothetical protein